MARDNYRVHAGLLTPPEVTDALPLLSHLAGLGVSRLALITDDAVGLARSLAAFRAKGYTLTRIQPIDLQPHQNGVMLIARFDRGTVGS